ncbi:hypothetical protein [Paraburkholderia xenovorans]|uniref:hypothetical protein n=1 Tax=Paraburkholderia xenovorans TaxID=36873 RepID=UPI0038B7B790
MCRLSDQRYITFNQGFPEMTGYVREDVIARAVYELDVFDARQRAPRERARCRQPSRGLLSDAVQQVGNGSCWSNLLGAVRENALARSGAFAAVLQ